jgi:hypothetical protein
MRLAADEQLKWMSKVLTKLRPAPRVLCRRRRRCKAFRGSARRRAADIGGPLELPSAFDHCSSEIAGMTFDEVRAET